MALSELIRGIGSRFDKRQWQNALRTGRVNLINVFAKCHHSWSYYPTTVGMRHPHLRLDLLGAQLEACHEIGVRCPIYFTVGWSAADALHPEWCSQPRRLHLRPRMGPRRTPDTPNVQWKCMCPSGGYHELMTAQVEECTGYEVDGFWFDIYQAERLCWCDLCLRGMLAAGLDIDHREDARYRADAPPHGGNGASDHRPTYATGCTATTPRTTWRICPPPGAATTSWRCGRATLPTWASPTWR